jgi:hypothetical protein
VKIKSRNEILINIIKDAEKYPKNWKAIFGKDNERLSNDYYLINPDIGIYLLKEYQKNPFEIKGVGGKIARHIDEEMDNEIAKFPDNFGIVQGDIHRILKNIEKGITPLEIYKAAIEGKNLGIRVPVRGQVSTSKDTFQNIREILNIKQKKIDTKFEKIATNDGLYKSYD